MEPAVLSTSTSTAPTAKSEEEKGNITRKEELKEKKWFECGSTDNVVETQRDDYHSDSSFEIDDHFTVNQQGKSTNEEEKSKKQEQTNSKKNNQERNKKEGKNKKQKFVEFAVGPK